MKNRYIALLIAIVLIALMVSTLSSTSKRDPTKLPIEEADTSTSVLKATTASRPALLQGTSAKRTPLKELPASRPALQEVKLPPIRDGKGYPVFERLLIFRMPRFKYLPRNRQLNPGGSRPPHETLQKLYRVWQKYRGPITKFRAWSDRYLQGLGRAAFDRGEMKVIDTRRIDALFKAGLVISKRESLSASDYDKVCQVLAQRKYGFIYRYHGGRPYYFVIPSDDQGYNKKLQEAHYTCLQFLKEFLKTLADDGVISRVHEHGALSKFSDLQKAALLVHLSPSKRRGFFYVNPNKKIPLRHRKR